MTRRLLVTWLISAIHPCPRADWHGHLMRETGATLPVSRKREGDESVVDAHRASCMGRECWVKRFCKRFAITL